MLAVTPELRGKEDIEKATSIGIIPFKESLSYLDLALMAWLCLFLVLLILFVFLVSHSYPLSPLSDQPIIGNLGRKELGFRPVQRYPELIPLSGSCLG